MIWKIWAKKVVVVFATGGVISLISFIESIPVDPESAIYLTLAATILKAIRNYVKHK